MLPRTMQVPHSPKRKQGALLNKPNRSPAKRVRFGKEKQGRRSMWRCLCRHMTLRPCFDAGPSRGTCLHFRLAGDGENQSIVQFLNWTMNSPPCGARRMLRAHAFPCILRPLRKMQACFFCHRQRKLAFSTGAFDFDSSPSLARMQQGGPSASLLHSGPSRGT